MFIVINIYKLVVVWSAESSLSFLGLNTLNNRNNIVMGPIILHKPPVAFVLNKNNPKKKIKFPKK